VTPFTLCYRAIPHDDEIAAVSAAATAAGGSAEWQIDARFNRAYALIEGVASPDGVRAAAATGAAAGNGAIIALAVFPSVPQALPHLREALGGAGRPAGVVSIEVNDTAAIVEWEFERTGSALVLAAIDAELARFRSGRVNELLSPLPLAAWTAIAAEGLRAAQIAPSRVLEALIEERDVVR
jgi:hypothetical protein